MRSCSSRRCFRTRPTGRSSDRCGSTPGRPIATSSSGASRRVERRGRMKHFRIFLATLALAAPLQSGLSAPTAQAQVGRERWTADQANGWYAQQPWLTGANFIPADAINELEMWQAAALRAAEIDPQPRWGRGGPGPKTVGGV